MRRFLVALVGTIAGLVALLSFKSATQTAGASASAGSTGGSVSSSGSSTTTSGGTGTSAGSTSGSAGSANGGSGASSAGGSKTVTGTVDQTQYGPMQVQLTVQGKKIIGVKVLQETNDGVQSQQIDGNAIPQLTKETLTAQSARIDAVSGATYTSAGYIKSLQSAIDQV